MKKRILSLSLISALEISPRIECSDSCPDLLRHTKPRSRFMAAEFLFPTFQKPIGSGFFRGLPLRSPVPHGFSD